jgi:beta-lactam-binding protein with PASTA domain
MSESAARAALERAGLRVLLVRRRETGSVEPGLVLEQQPAAGDSVAPGTFVNLVLESEGRPARGDSARTTAPVTCTVPTITGLTRDEAERRLALAGLRGDGARDQGELPTVTSQRQRPETKVPCGSAVSYRYGRVG